MRRGRLIGHNRSVPRNKISPSAPVLDPTCAKAVDQARAAAVEEAPEGAVGAHQGVTAEGERLVDHRFECLLPGYRNWFWSVTIARASRARVTTVCEVVLLPGEGAIVAPEWVSWSERVEAGDLGAGVLVPTEENDERLTNGWSGSDDLAGELDSGPLHPVCWEPGLGRSQVLSPEGRTDAATRWYGERGPASQMAKAAPANCATCGWLLTIGGPLGQMFGLCTHALSPSDGRAVALDYGCGAHSSVRAESPSGRMSVPVVDDLDDIDFGHS